MTLSGASAGATFTTPTGTGTINDNDVPLVLDQQCVTVAVNEGPRMTFTVTKTGARSVHLFGQLCQRERYGDVGHGFRRDVRNTDLSVDRDEQDDHGRRPTE